jgi:hypothetical protein
MVIVDSSSLIHLSAIGRFALLKDLYGQLTVTPAVWRGPAGPNGGPSLQSNQLRTFPLTGQCGIPRTARALSVNVTVTAATGSGFLTLSAADQQAGGTSTINFEIGRTLANNAILRLSGEGFRQYQGAPQPARHGSFHPGRHRLLPVASAATA